MEQTMRSQGDAGVGAGARGIDADATGVDPRVALAAGAGVFMSSVVWLLPGGWLYGSGGALVLLGGIGTAVAFAAMAYGLVGTGRITRWSLIASGALVLLGRVLLRFVPTSPDDLFSPAGRALGTVLSCIDYASLVGLVAAAVFVSTSPGSWRTARIALRVLAAVALIGLALPLPLVALPDSALQSVATALSWTTRLTVLASCAVGIALAWPWLAPRVARARLAATHARDRWVDTTP